jgi:hypothetical protein
MSILKSIFGRKAAKEQATTDNPVTEPEIAKIQEVLASVTLDPDFTISTDHPIPDNMILLNDPVSEPVNEVATTAETVEVDADESCKDVGCQCKHGHDHDHDKIETIPLGNDELESLQNSRYEEIKDRFTKTFVIEKHFWAFVNSIDPTKPGRTPVKVKRVAEIKAASLMNALNMLGWDTKNTTLVDTKDEFKNEVEISVDGRPVSRVALPEGFEQFETLGCGARKLLVYGLKDKAVADESVQKLVKEKMLVVSGWNYQPRQRINLVTSHDKPAREAAKAKKNSKNPIELVVADKPVDAAVEAPAIDRLSSCPEDAPSKCVQFDSPEASKAAMLNAIVDGCERSAKQVEAVLK